MSVLSLTAAEKVANVGAEVRAHPVQIISFDLEKKGQSLGTDRLGQYGRRDLATVSKAVLFKTVPDQRLLDREVFVQRPLGDIGSFGNGFHGDAVESMRLEQFPCCCADMVGHLLQLARAPTAIGIRAACGHGGHKGVFFDTIADGLVLATH